MDTDKSGLVLVTGGTGYVASHLIRVLLQNDFKVRTTVRSVAKKEKYQFLIDMLPEKKDNLTFVEADLLKKDQWPAACEGVEKVYHVASPFVLKPKSEKELIQTAEEGTANVMEAAIAKGVKKIVVTASIVSMREGRETEPINEQSWSIEARCSPYPKSKLKAEQKAWEIYNANMGKFELCTIHPGLVLGPFMQKSGGESETFLIKLLTKGFPAMARIQTPIADVRDVAEVHMKAMESKEANGHRILCLGGAPWFENVIGACRTEFQKYGYKFPSMKVGRCLLKCVACCDETAKTNLTYLDVEQKYDTSFSKKELGHEYRSFEASLIDGAYSLIKLGVIADKTKGAAKDIKYLDK